MNLKIIKWGIILSLVFDALNTVLQYYDLPFDRASVFFKAFFEIIIIVLFIYNRKFGKYYLMIIYFGITFFISYLLFVLMEGDVFNLEPFIILNKYLYFIILSFLFIQYSENEKFVNFISNVFKYYLLFNSAFIILGLLFNIELFSSYFKLASQRFGYKGLIPAQNEATGVYFWGLAFFYRRYFVEKSENIWNLIFVTFASLLIGTKGIWISVLFFMAYYLLKYKTRKTVLIGIPSLIAVISIYGIRIWDTLYNDYLYYFIHFIERTDMSWYTILLSGRDVKTAISFEYIKDHWTIWNYIFGGVNLSIANSETDLVDGYFSLGINFILYLIYYFSLLFKFDKSMDNVLIFLLYTVLSFTGGHMIYSAIVPLFYLMYIFSYRISAGRVMFQ